MRTELLCTARATKSGEQVTGWYCAGNVLKDGEFDRTTRSFIMPEYPDLRESSIGVVRIHGLIEVDPATVRMKRTICG